MPTARFAAAAGMVFLAGRLQAQTVLYSTSFEAPTFAPGNLAAPLSAGQGNWRIDYDNPAKIQIVSGGARTGLQSLQMTAETADAGGGWAWWDPLQVNPIVAAAPELTVQYSMFLASTGTVSGGWGVEMFSTNLTTMGRMQVAPNNVIQVDNNGVWTDTSAVASRGTWHNYRLVYDFIARTYDAYFNNTLIADNFGFDADNGVVGDVDFRHWQPDPANDFARFDDLEISIGGRLPDGAEWANDISGDWNVGANWSTGFVPNGATVSAKLGTHITAPRQVNLTTQVSLDQLLINSAQSYTLAGDPVPGSHAIRFAGQLPTAIGVSAGSHNFAAAVRIEKDASLNIGTASTLRFSNRVDVAGRNITKLGDGTLLLTQIRANSLTIDNGLVKLTGTGTLAGANALGVLTINAGTLDLNGHSLVIDYTAGSPNSAIRQALASGLLVDSTTVDPRIAVGYVDNNVLGLTQIGDLALDDTALVIRPTLKGDGNLDGRVTVTDFALIGSAFNQPGVWYTGDFNYDGLIGIGDFSYVAAYFNQSITLPRTGNIPEPVALSLLGFIMLLRRTRR